jgi:hypothetical protein
MNLQTIIRWFLREQPVKRRDVSFIHQIKVNPDEGIHEVALRASGYAEAMNRYVEVRFNGVHLVVLPTSSWVDIIDEYLRHSSHVFQGRA